MRPRVMLENAGYGLKASTRDRPRHGGQQHQLNRGAKIFFDENQTLFLWLNPKNTRLEFRYLETVLGYLDLNTAEHPLSK